MDAARGFGARLNLRVPTSALMVEAIGEAGMGLGRFLIPAQREALLASVLSGGTGVALFSLTESTSRFMVIASGIVVALALFFWRLRFRFLYGLIEIGFGLLVLYDASGKGRGAFSSDFSKDFDTFQLSVVVIQTFGAIYVLIRGMDNLLQGLPIDVRTRFETRVREWHL